jgi:hypothetical protein
MSSDDDDVDDTRLLGLNASVDRDVSAADDASGVGITFVKATIPGLSKAIAPGSSKPLAADRVLIVPASSTSNRKCMHLVVKWCDPGPRVNQVMIQVELSPYHGPHSSLDLVALEIVFGRMFEAFHRVSRVL